MRNNKIKIVVDTNVFIKGLIFSYKYESDGDAIDILLELIKKDKIELVFSQDTIGELVCIYKNKVLHYIKKNQLKYMYNIIKLFFISYSVNIRNMENISELKCADPEDDMFLQCAKQGHAKYIISDDLRSKMKETLMKYKEHHKNFNINVLTAKEFVEVYNKSVQARKDESAMDIDEDDESN